MAEATYHNIHYFFGEPDEKGKYKMTGDACSSLDQALKSVAGALKWSEARDVYFCISTQNMAERKETANGGVRMKARKGRNNAVRCKVFCIDIDAGNGDEEKGYADTAQAVAAYKGFLAFTGLPPATLLVASGSGGIQPHWVIDNALEANEWQALANALAEAGRRYGLKFDSARTVDIASLMRVPGTFNRKADTPRAVTLAMRAIQPDDVHVEDLKRILAPYGGAKVINFPAKAAPALTLNAELAGGIGERGKAPPIMLQSVADAGCGFIGTALADGGKSYDQTLWNLTTLVATFTEEGVEAAKAMAMGHPGYVEDETVALYERKQAERAAHDLGWPSCQAIATAGCQDCQGCPLFGLAKSPLNFGKAKDAPAAGIVAAANPEDDLPTHYERDSKGRIFQRYLTKEAEWDRRMVSPYPMTGGWLQDSPWMINFDCQLKPFGPPVQIQMTTEDLSGREFGKKIGRQGLALPKAMSGHLQEFLLNWTSHLQQLKDSVVSAAPFGWSVPNGKIDGFCYGGRVWGAGVDRPAANPDPLLHAQYTPRGEIEPWLAACRMITSQGRPDLDAIIALSFGAPLVRFTGQSGLLVSAYSTQSGIGKSTAVKVGQSVWGNPISGVQTLTDTAASVMKKVGDLQALPLYWDELKTEGEIQKFTLMAFQITQGKERSRLTSSVDYRQTGTWQTMMLAASNDSLLDFVSRQTKTTTAGLYRVFEFTVAPIPDAAKMDHTMVARTVARTHDNFGHAGLIYAKFLGEHHERIAAEMAEWGDKLATKVKAAPDERFWIATMTCLMFGAKYARECGLADIDAKGLFTFLQGVLFELRRERNTQPVDMREGMSVSAILADFLGTKRAENTLYTNRVHVSRGRPSAMDPIEEDRDHSRLKAVHVHVGVENEILRIQSSALRRWLTDNGYSAHIVTAALKEKFGARETQGILGAGTKYATTKDYLFEINMAGAEGATFFGNEPPADPEPEAEPAEAAE